MSDWPAQKICEVADGIFTLVHGRGEAGVANATFAIERGQTLVVDTMTFPEMASGLVDEIARRNGRVEIVLNTHHHIDHMGGNKLFTDARIVAHPASIRVLQKLGFPLPVYQRLMPQFKEHFTDLELILPAPLPERLVLPRGGELLAFTPAHTPADLAVWFPRSRVLIAGDICFKGVVPLAVNGLISGWLEALEAMIALEPEVVVPGHGAPGTLSDLLILRDYFASLQYLGRAAVQEKRSLLEALALFDPGPLTEWIEPERHAINLERVMQEARGEISRADLSAMPLSAQKN